MSRQEREREREKVKERERERERERENAHTVCVRKRVCVRQCVHAHSVRKCLHAKRRSKTGSERETGSD